MNDARRTIDDGRPVRIDAATRPIALLGFPVAHSRSPALHNAAFRAQGLNFVYLALPVRPAAVAGAVAGLRALGFAGANVTVPHKQAVLPLLDELSPRAGAVGAVNTIVCRAGGAVLYGDNTDVAGFLAPLAGEELGGAEMLIFGAGGAARAAAYALLTTFQPLRLTLVARTAARAERLAADLAPFDAARALHVATPAEARAAVRASRLLVNATPLGMHPDVAGTPWPQAADFSAGQLVYDLVYAPPETRLLRDAAARGARTVGGLGMLLHQAAAAYVQWTGHEMPLGVARAVLEGETRRE